MSFTEKRLCNPTQLTTSGQTLYTVPASKTAIIKQVVVTNVTGSAATFSLYIGSATAANALFSATSVAANDAIVINLSQVLNSTEILTALASANSTLNITISGVENDGPLNPLSTYIADDAITTAKLADSSVTTAKIAAGAVVNADIADGAITSAKIQDGTIVNADISTSAAIDKTKISGTAITAADIDAKGDLFVGTADNAFSRFAVGTNTQGLVVDSSTASGLRWADIFQRQSGASSGESSTINISPRPWNLAWGVVSNAVDSSTQVNFSSETTMLTTTSFTAVASRRYKVTYCEPSISLVSGTVNGLAAIIRLTNISGSVLYVRDFTAANIASTNVSLFLSFTTTFSAGATVLNASTGTAGGGTARGARTATRSAYLLVEDIGPA